MGGGGGWICSKNGVRNLHLFLLHVPVTQGYHQKQTIENFPIIHATPALVYNWLMGGGRYIPRM